MADKETENNTEKQLESEGMSKPQDTSKGKIGIVTWVIMVTIVGALCASGYFVGSLFANSAVGTSETDVSVSEGTSQTKQTPTDAKPPVNASEETWYYEDLDPVVVNPDEPGATRFIRVSLILEISNELPPEQAKAMFAAKKPLLINWLNLYFKSMSLDQMENDKDMKHILYQICEGFNEILFPEAKPQIKNVLIREFNIQ